MITIYHNPRCTKSREALEILSQKHDDFEIVHYLKNPLNEDMLIKLLDEIEGYWNT